MPARVPAARSNPAVAPRAGESGAAGPRISVAPPARPPIRYAPETNNILAQAQEEHVMPEKLISGDNHIDLTYCRPDLWSSAAPNKWKQQAPRVGSAGGLCPGPRW